MLPEHLVPMFIQPVRDFWYFQKPKKIICGYISIFIFNKDAIQEAKQILVKTQKVTQRFESSAVNHC